MPTYSYRCTSCGHAFDIHQAFSDDTLTECPNCGGALRKVFSPVGVTFSGSGFYRTDSRAADKKNTEKRNGSSVSSSDSKPAASASPAPSSTPSPSPAKSSNAKPSTAKE